MPCNRQGNQVRIYNAIKGLVILSVLMIIIWQTMMKKKFIMLHKQTRVNEVQSNDAFLQVLLFPEGSKS